MLTGTEDTPNNFVLVPADTGLNFHSPRHRHNFDQVRVGLEGSTSIGPKHNIEPGEVVYFPEGTRYATDLSLLRIDQDRSFSLPTNDQQRTLFFINARGVSTRAKSALVIPGRSMPRRTAQPARP